MVIVMNYLPKFLIHYAFKFIEPNHKASYHIAMNIFAIDDVKNAYQILNCYASFNQLRLSSFMMINLKIFNKIS